MLFKLVSPDTDRPLIVKEGKPTSDHVNINFSTPSLTPTIVPINNGDKNINSTPYIHEIYQYYNNNFETTNNHVLTCFHSKIFSGSLRRITEIVITEDLQPECDSFWDAFKKSFVMPEVYINGE